MARKTRRQKQRASARQPAMAQARPGVPSGPEPLAGPSPARPAAPAEREPETAPAMANGTTPVETAAPPGAAVPAPAIPSSRERTERTGEVAARRRVERIVPGAPPPASPAAGPAGAPGRPGRAAPSRSRFTSAAAMVVPLESEDPAIPFDRVPYVPADLRRVAIIAGVMVVLILIAWVVVTRVTGS